MSEKLNNKYNIYSSNNGISDCSVAYRTNLSNGKKTSNITIAKEVFDFIDYNCNVWVMKGDFKGFFDNLNHNILNKNFIKVLEIKDNSSKKSAWMKVIKNLENFIYIDKEKLDKLVGTHKFKRNNTYAYFNSIKDFGTFIKKNKYLLNKNKTKGIPQGTSISAILANIYMIEFDKTINKLLYKYNALYRRYSDDFIIVIPKNKMSELEFLNIEKHIRDLSNKLTHLIIEKNKTKILSINNGNVYDLNTKSKSSLDYLGFIFSNNTVSFRGKSIYKFYYRGRKALKAASAAKEIYEILNKYFDYNYAIDDKTAKKVLNKKLESNLRVKSMNFFKTKANIHRIKRIMYHHKNHVGLPELRTSYQKYLMKIKNSKPRYSFISYIKSVDKIFNTGSKSYKVSIIKQGNKIRNRLLKYKK